MLLTTAPPLTPPVTILNTVAATVPLTIQGASGQSADLQRWTDSTGAVLAKVDSVGDVIGWNLAVPTGNQIVDSGTIGPSIIMGASAITVQSRQAANNALIVKGVANQSVDLQQWQSSTPTTLAKITNTGDFSCKTIIPGTLDTMSYASTIALDVTLAEVHKVTTVNATGNATINASSGGTAGQRMTIIIVNDATSGKVITFGTNFRVAGTVTGQVSKVVTISFISDGTSWFQESVVQSIV